MIESVPVLVSEAPLKKSTEPVLTLEIVVLFEEPEFNVNVPPRVRVVPPELLFELRLLELPPPREVTRVPACVCTSERDNPNRATAVLKYVQQ